MQAILVLYPNANAVPANMPIICNAYVQYICLLAKNNEKVALSSNNDDGHAPSFDNNANAAVKSENVDTIYRPVKILAMSNEYGEKVKNVIRLIVMH